MELRWLPFASEQLKVVAEYVKENFGENTAKKSIRKILDKVNTLKLSPNIGVWDKIYSTDKINIRHLNIGPNMVFYLTDEEEIVVIAVMHYKQSPATMNSTIQYVLQNFIKR